jgi:hypothetical protein
MHRVNEVWANDFRAGKQANFLALSDPPVLSLVGIDEEDAGTYTCRVDFRRSQTRYAKVDLVVIGQYDDIIFFFSSVVKTIFIQAQRNLFGNTT